VHFPAQIVKQFNTVRIAAQPLQDGIAGIENFAASVWKTCASS
jgi:hypothetical protein